MHYQRLGNAIVDGFPNIAAQFRNHAIHTNVNRGSCKVDLDAVRMYVSLGELLNRRILLESASYGIGVYAWVEESGARCVNL